MLESIYNLPVSAVGFIVGVSLSICAALLVLILYVISNDWTN